MSVEPGLANSVLVSATKLLTDSKQNLNFSAAYFGTEIDSYKNRNFCLPSPLWCNNDSSSFVLC